MGKPDNSGNSFSDALSLHDNPGQSSSTAPYLDNDAPEINLDDPNLADLPPNYSDAIESEAAPMLAPGSAMNDTVKPSDFNASVITDKTTGAQAWVAGSVEDPASLERYITQLSSIPPRPFIQLVGTHTETTKDSKGKEEKSTITDFDVMVDLTPYLYADAQYRTAWTQIQTVENSDKVRRGTVLRKRGAGSNQSIELGDAKPTLREWCHLFAASPARLKCFTLRRKVVGFDEEGVKKRLVELVRKTNYRGRLQVELVTKDAQVEFYNDVTANRWRLTPWIRWLFTLTLLFIFTWPYLFFKTKRWEVVTIEWPFSRKTESGGVKEYVSLSEDQWYNLWGQAICRAVLQKKQAVLDQADLRTAHEADPAFNTGSTHVDSALGIFRAGINAMNEVNRQLGWGDDC